MSYDRYINKEAEASRQKLLDLQTRYDRLAFELKAKDSELIVELKKRDSEITEIKHQK